MGMGRSPEALAPDALLHETGLLVSTLVSVLPVAAVACWMGAFCTRVKKVDRQPMLGLDVQLTV